MKERFATALTLALLVLTVSACPGDDPEVSADAADATDATDATSADAAGGDTADATAGLDAADAAEVDGAAPAVAVDDAWVVVPGEAFAQAAPGVLANDAAAAEVVTTTATSAQGAAVVMTADGGFTYATPARMAGADSFVYVARGAGGELHEATVTLTPRAGCGDGDPVEGEVCFARAPHADIGDGSLGAVADLDGDGVGDLVTASRLPVALAVRIGDGEGGFGPPSIIDLDLEDDVVALATGRVDGDGHMDVVLLTDAGVLLLSGDGAGGLTPASAPAAALSNGRHVALGDFVGDASLDVLVVDGDALRVFEGDGAGGLAAPVATAHAAFPVGVAVADLDDDGHLDAILTRDPAGVVVALGDGAGAFTVAAVDLPDFGTGAPVVGRFDDDEHLDVAALTTGFTGTLSVHALLGDGEGGLTPTGSPLLIDGFDAGLQAARLDGDADTDLLLAGTGALVPLLSDGAGGFVAGADVQDFEIRWALPVDLDGDGADGAVLLRPGEIGLVDNDGAGVLTAREVASDVVAYPISGAILQEVVLVDLDGDGALDVVTADYQGAALQVAYGDGAGGLGVFAAVSVGDGAQGVAVGDVDGDDVLDLVSANTLADTVSVRLGDGEGGFVAASIPEVSVGAGPARVLLVDVDGDGHLDLLTANTGLLGGSSGPGGDSVSVRLGDGEGGFAPPAASEVSTGIGTEALALARLDDDALLDLVALNLGDETATVHLGAGEGAFGAGEVAPLRAPRRVALVDLVGDEALDLVASSEARGSLQLAEGQGDGTFVQVSRELRVAARAFDVVVVDLDGDGHRDVLVAGVTAAALLLGDVDGGLARAAGGALDAPGISLAVGDLDGDGFPDVVSTAGGRVLVNIARH